MMTKSLIDKTLALKQENIDLAYALKQIEGGHIQGASNYVLSGDWQGIVGKLQEIARTALANRKATQ